MAFLDGIFNRQQPAAPAAPASGTPSAAGPAMHQPAPANPGANPAAMGNNPPAPPAGGPQNPMDAFSDIFKPRPVDPKAVKQPTISDPMLAPLDAVKFKEQVAATNFASNIPPETIQKAISGDATAFADAINTAAREAFAAAAQLSHGLVEHGSRTAAERVNGSLDSRIRNFQIRSQNTSNEALTHPAVAPMLNAVKIQIAQANPTLTPDAVQQQAEQYFTQMSEVLTAPKQAAAANNAAKPKEGDFAYLLS